MDTTQYLDVFIDESNEHLEVLSNQLLSLEKDPQDKTIIEEIFRAAHTLKGMSATMGYQDLADLTHKLENVFDAIRYDRITVQTEMMDVLFTVLEQLHAMVEDISSGGDGKQDIAAVVQQLQAIEDGSGLMHATKDENSHKTDVAVDITLDEYELSILEQSAEQGFHNYKIHVRLISDCLLKGVRAYMVFDALGKLGEIIHSEPSVTELEEENFDDTFTIIFVSKESEDKIKSSIVNIAEIEQVVIENFAADAGKKTSEVVDKKEGSPSQAAEKGNGNTSHQAPAAGHKTIRVNTEKLDSLMNLFEEMVIDRSRLEQISSEVNHKELQETVEHMSRISGDLQDIILSMRMVPIEQVFSRFPRMIRKLARELDKNITLEISGADTELDRTVIDEIGDPLVHLLRNAIDHGIETPEQRKSKGKSEQGTINLRAYHSGNHVFIEIVDDGAGINKEKVIQKAIENHIITADQKHALTDQEAFELIMESGFSTADKISDISGRGVGLDVVRSKIESLGGSVIIHSEHEKGSKFIIQLPLTLSIIAALLVKLQTEIYAIPLSTIVETAIIRKQDILSAHQKKVIDFRGSVVPLVFLKDIFHVPAQEAPETDFLSVVIIKKGEKMAGLVVDTFIGQQEIVLKSLGNYLTEVFAISGATILGNGKVALIIDSNALIK
ncbi:chemotaxis protein CheA [Virgibacillus sp. 179-BFC.A HS]|uniref:Chemotaxis protein CheA n=1 Tax=Tigheibacillus jepli TaxID=3035914 RepID=A0ABU5CJ82_9BACI|nr:chemotaxis protein CheA [Virgibacillus sp. 179-BFC.A HS]MDY0405869.1 chemotaxis protein CheA [Virgibacillus sp. 179-BFC.A HS]